MKAKLAGIQYVGDNGITQECKKAVINIIHAGERVEEVKILTFEEMHSNAHALLLTLEFDIQIVVKGGFASGYNGEGPKGYAFVLNLLRQYTDNIDECVVPQKIFERISSSSLTVKDLEYINSIEKVHPARWYEFIHFSNENKNNFSANFPLLFLWLY